MAEIDLDEVLTALRARYAAARFFMQQRGRRKGVLIYVGTQHPLDIGPDGKRDQPGREFAARLDKALDLLNRFKANGFHVQIFAAASLHKHEGIWDDVSLRVAASRYLIAKGATEADLVDDIDLADLMRLCDLEAIGTSQDEVKAVTTLFKLDERFGYIYAVGGHAQMARLLAGCLINGVLATASTPEVFDDDGYPLAADDYHHKIDYESWATFQVALALLSDELGIEAAARDAVLRQARTVPGGLTGQDSSVAGGQLGFT